MNKTSKFLRGVGVALALVGLPARGITGGEAAAVAGATAALMVAVPAVSEALTYSKVCVKVEAYMETERLTTNQLRLLGYSNFFDLSPDEWRSKPFKLGGPAALKRAADAATNGPGCLCEDLPGLALKLDEVSKQLDFVIGALTNAVSEMQKRAAKLDVLRAGTNSATVPKTNELWQIAFDLQQRLDNGAKLQQKIQDFLGLTLKKAADMRTLELAYCQMRVAAEACHAPFIIMSDDLFVNQLKSVLINPGDFLLVTTNGTNVTTSKLDTNAGPTSKLMTALVDRAAPPKDSSGNDKIASSIFNTLKVIGLLKEGPINVGGQTIKSATRPEELEEHAAKVIQAFGYPVQVVPPDKGSYPGPLPLARLEAADTAQRVASLLAMYYLPEQSIYIADNVVNLGSFAGISTGANMGPIINEVFQSVFSKSQIIDAMLTDDRKWKKMNYSYSKSRAGDHNAVIYFDNSLMPILKTGTFDPSEFLAANAQLYKRVTSALAGIYGLPLSPGGGSGTGGTNGNANSFADFNLYTQKARAQNAQQAASKDRRAMMDALKALIAAGNSIQSKTAATPANTWSGADATAQAATGKDQVAALKTAMGKVLQDLQARQTAAAP
jgi:hypothetical protein